MKFAHTIAQHVLHNMQKTEVAYLNLLYFYSFSLFREFQGSKTYFFIIVYALPLIRSRARFANTVSTTFFLPLYHYCNLLGP